MTVGVNGRIEFTVALPSDIRSDYPDVIAGSSDGIRQVPQIRLFVRDGGGTITEISAVVGGGGASQIIVVDSLAGGTVVGSTPTNGDSEFNLWELGVPVGVATGIGSLPADDYELAIAADYPSPNPAITKISHDPSSGCITELELSLSAAIALANILSLIQLEGVAQAQRKILDFNSRLIQIVDEPGNERLRLQLPEVGRITVTGSAPTVADDSSLGYEVGDRWFNSASIPDIYDLVDATVGAALWILSGSGGGGGGISTAADLAALKALIGIPTDSVYLLKINALSNCDNTLYRYDSSSAATAA